MSQQQVNSAIGISLDELRLFNLRAQSIIASHGLIRDRCALYESWFVSNLGNR